MSEYIERDAFIAEQRHLYCDNCERRKGIMKNGKMRFAYEIGDAPCRACRYGDVLDDLEDYPAADVRPVVLCRDCVNYVESGEAKDEKMCAIDAEWCVEDGCYYGFTAYTPPDGFCWLGKKREES